MQPEHKTTRKRRLKVYGGNLDGRREAVMAAHSFKQFQAATRINRDYGGETKNTEAVAVAMSAPGAVFVRSILARAGTPWERMK